MLEVDYHAQLEAILATIDCRVKLPAEWSEFFARRGVLKTTFDDQRRFVRSHFPGKAVLELAQTIAGIEREHRFCCVYTKDLSRIGISFLHCEELFPGETPTLWLLSGKSVCNVVRRVRHNPRCFEIGATFRELPA